MAASPTAMPILASSALGEDAFGEEGICSTAAQRRGGDASSPPRPHAASLLAEQLAATFNGTSGGYFAACPPTSSPPQPSSSNWASGGPGTGDDVSPQLASLSMSRHSSQSSLGRSHSQTASSSHDVVVGQGAGGAAAPTTTTRARAATATTTTSGSSSFGRRERSSSGGGDSTPPPSKAGAMGGPLSSGATPPSSNSANSTHTTSSSTSHQPGPLATCGSAIIGDDGHHSTRGSVRGGGGGAMMASASSPGGSMIANERARARTASGASPSAGAGGGMHHGFGSTSVADHSEITFTYDGYDEDASMSGYSAGGAESTLVEDLNSIYYTRLVRFYERYNPEKIARAEEFLAAYKGDEEDLFRVLTEKYGPEPELPKYYRSTGVADGASSVGEGTVSAGGGSRGRKQKGLSPSHNDPMSTSFHFVGARAVQVPERVAPLEGRTEVATPYWPMCRLVTDRDILELFLKQRTENVELRKCFMGSLQAHPVHVWNGMTYLSSCPLPSDVTKPFLGHTWSGTLANNKTLLYKTDYFRRTVLHCTPECQECPLPPPVITASSNNAVGPNSISNHLAKRTSGELGASGGAGSVEGSSVRGGSGPSSHSGQGDDSLRPSAGQPAPSEEGGATKESAATRGADSSPQPQPSIGDASTREPSPCDEHIPAAPPLLPPHGSSGGVGHGHGRWRLVIYHSEACPYALFRVMYDPVLTAMGGAQQAQHHRQHSTCTVDADVPPSQHHDASGQHQGTVPSAEGGGGGGDEPSIGDAKSNGEAASNAQQQQAASPPPAKKSNFFTFSFSRKSKEKREAEAAAKAAQTIASPPAPTPQPQQHTPHPSHTLGTIPSQPDGTRGSGGAREPMIMNSAVRSLRRDEQLPADAYYRHGAVGGGVGGASSRSSSQASSSIPERRVGVSPSARAAMYKQPSQPTVAAAPMGQHHHQQPTTSSSSPATAAVAAMRGYYNRATSPAGTRSPPHGIHSGRRDGAPTPPPLYGEAVGLQGEGGAAVVLHPQLAAMLGGLEARIMERLDGLAARVDGLERAVGVLQQQQQMAEQRG